MPQGPQDQRARFVDSAILSTMTGLGEQGLRCRFVVLTLLSSRLRLFCFRKRQGQRSSPLSTKD
ncbi:hypothetical protein SynRS9902_00045 [Synechococcus sp. RS9902]|nr:hypothetical protein SynRS9902_00045 [Synechococcus sp. RS9902]